MSAPPIPRNQRQRDRFSTPPSASAFSTPPPSAAASVGAGGDTPLHSNPLRSASKRREVLLCDWWLVAAAEAIEGRRLCVGGIVAGRCPWRNAPPRFGSKSLLSPRQKAVRVFESAPITKRHGAFTLGTADGITVRIQGVIDQGRSHQNGFPLEVTDGFLVGFPYNWDSYAGACFEETYNSTSAPANAASANDISKGLSDTKGCLFTVHLDDFTFGRIHGASIDGIDGSVTRKCRDFLERFCDRHSRNTTKRMLSDVQDCSTPIVKSCLPQETLNKFEGVITDGWVAEGLEHMSHFEEVSVSNPSGQCETLVEGQCETLVEGQCETLVEMHPSKEEKSDVITCEDKPSTQHKTKRKYPRKTMKSSKKKESSLFVNQDCKKTSSSHSSRRTIWRPSYVSQCPLTRDRATKLCIASPESLDLKRSKRGRLLVPRISEWCQKIVYAVDGEIEAISGDNLDNFPVIGIHSEPPRKRRRHV